MLVRVIEQSTGDTWRNIHTGLERMHLDECAGPAGRVVQRTETTPRQHEILKSLKIPEPPLVHELSTPSKPRQRSERPV
jgi:hypothetical protein